MLLCNQIHIEIVAIATRSLLGTMGLGNPHSGARQLKFRDHPTAGAGPVQGGEESCPTDLKGSIHVLKFPDHPHGGGAGWVQRRRE